MMGVESEAYKTVQLQAAEVLSLLEIIDKKLDASVRDARPAPRKNRLARPRKAGLAPPHPVKLTNPAGQN